VKKQTSVRRPAYAGSRAVRVTHEVYDLVARQARFGETFDDALRRLFKLPKRPK
jgi:negative regulator of replication initiation